MRIFVLPVIAFASCATPRAEQRGIDPWCFSEVVQGDLVRLSQARASAVSLGRMSDALSRLRDRTVIELTRDEASRYLGERLDGDDRYYLARGAAYARRGADLSELLRSAAEATFDIEWIASHRTVLITTLQPSGNTQTLAQNVPLVLIADVQVQRVAVACYSLR